MNVERVMASLGWTISETVNDDGSITLGFARGRSVADGVCRPDGDRGRALLEAAFVSLVGGHVVMRELSDG